MLTAACLREELLLMDTTTGLPWMDTKALFFKTLREENRSFTSQAVTMMWLVQGRWKKEIYIQLLLFFQGPCPVLPHFHPSLDMLRT